MPPGYDDANRDKIQHQCDLINPLNNLQYMPRYVIDVIRHTMPGYCLGEPLGIEPAAWLVKLAARRPARACWLGDRSLVPTRYNHRVPCCGLPRSTWRRD